MTRTAIKSNKFHSIGYQSEDCILEIEYKTKAIYHFINVPRKIYQSLLNPEIGSHDDFFNKIIEGKYSFYKVDG